MPELRPCKFKHQYIKDGKWVTSKEKDGLFHQWGNDFEDCSVQGIVPFVVGIVEDKIGLEKKVYMVRPTEIKFTDK